MIRLLCLLGIHRTIWQPRNEYAVDDLDGHVAAWTVQVRTCRDCGHLVGRTHRD